MAKVLELQLQHQSFQQRDGWMASPTRWTWVWVNSRCWWWIGRPGVLWFMGSQRVGHDWVTELKYRSHAGLFLVIIHYWRAPIHLESHLLQNDAERGRKQRNGLVGDCNLGALFHNAFFLNMLPPLPRIGEGNGTPLQYSCLENPMGRGA